MNIQAAYATPVRGVDCTDYKADVKGSLLSPVKEEVHLRHQSVSCIPTNIRRT